MKRLLCALLALCLLPCAALGEEKLSAMPEIFRVAIERTERFSPDEKSLIKVEKLKTVNEDVNKAVGDIVDAFDAQLSPTLNPAPHPRKNSRLDVNTVYYRTGRSWLSTLILARVSYKRVQVQSPFTTRTFDLETGERILLTDIFPDDSDAWQLMAERVRAHFATLYPNDVPKQDAIDALCTKEALAQADFTLSAMELTLHYESSQFFPGRAGLVHVRFYYPEFAGMMTDEGARQTDNSRWKMVAITCDDGPSYAESAKALDGFREYGARATYFIVGKKLAGFGDIEMREFDENHVIACHSFHHWSGYSIKIISNRLKELTMTNDALYELSGEAARYFRAPGGTYPPWAKGNIGLPIIQWSLVTYDYTGKAAKRIFYSVRNSVKDGDIILMHDSGKEMWKSVPMIAEYLLNNGYMMVTLDELAAYEGATLEPNAVYMRFDEEPIIVR